MKAQVLAELRADRAAKCPVALVTDLGSGEQRLVRLPDPEHDPGSSDGLLDAARQALREDRSRTFEAEEGRVFIQVHNPPYRMIIVGAVHITQPLVRMAALAGYAVTIVDPRGAFATQGRFPNAAVTRDWPDLALSALAPDARTAVVTLTHDPKLDDPALAVALRSHAFYVGSLGSRRTHEKRCERLRAAGLDDAAIARIHGPVGLAIGAKSPAEIAVAILSEITQVRRSGATRSAQA